MEFLFYIILTGVYNYGASELSVPCNSKVYCFGPLLRTVQMSGIFEDSKLFVDMKMKKGYALTLINFEKMMFESCDKPSNLAILNFVNANFEEGNELVNWRPTDFNENQTFLNSISDPIIKNFAHYLIKNWLRLGKKVKPEVEKRPSSYSLIPIPNSFIIPNERFREYYYWDSYWIVKGLMLSEMPESAKGIINNFFTIVKEFGFIPNGGRIYYADRSQPPLLTKMVWEYYRYTKNKSWLKKYIEYLDTELRFWLDKRTIQILKNNVVYTLAHYSAESTKPRPEAFFEDYTLGEPLLYSEDRYDLLREIKAEVESGWNLSSRWIFDDQGGNNATRGRVQVRRVVPVDLNAYLCEAFKIMVVLYLELGKTSKAKFWKKARKEWEIAVESVFWNEEDGIWYDVDLKTGNFRRYYYASNITPLWCNCLKGNITLYGKLALNYLTTIGVLFLSRGVPVSFTYSGEQWDYPYAWPPFQDILVEALDQSGDPKAVTAAKRIALKFLKTNIEHFKATGHMYEKYDVNKFEQGRGDKYYTGTSSAWSTAVAINFITKYYSSNESIADILTFKA